MSNTHPMIMALRACRAHVETREALWLASEVDTPDEDACFAALEAAELAVEQALRYVDWACLEDELSDYTLDDCELTTYGELCAEHDVDSAYVLAGIAKSTPVAILPGWTADDGNAPVAMDDALSGKEAARRYVEEGEWGEREETLFFSIYAWRQALTLDEDGEIIELRVDSGEHTVTLQPEAPPCDDSAGHRWCSPHDVVGGIVEAPGVWSSGGGVKIREVCYYCGRYRVTDTWATNPVNGTQGHTSVAYEEPDADSLAWVRGEDFSDED